MALERRRWIRGLGPRQCARTVKATLLHRQMHTTVPNGRPRTSGDPKRLPRGGGTGLAQHHKFRAVGHLTLHPRPRFLAHRAHRNVGYFTGGRRKVGCDFPSSYCQINGGN